MEPTSEGARVPSIVRALRSATGPSHRRLECRLGLAGPTLTLTRYRRLLGALYGFYEPLESSLGERATELLTWGVDVDARRKGSRLRDDLSSLGLDRARIPRLSREAIPSRRTIGEDLGCLYVVEGATLGGQIIYCRARDAFGLDSNHGSSFFYGYGADTGARFSELIAALEAYELARGPDEILGASRATFAALESWLERRGCLT